MRDMSVTATFSITFNRRRWLALLLMVVVAGCSGPARQRVYQPGAIESQLMAEVAVQRGEFRAAAQEYIRVAQRSDDVEYARRATEFAYGYGLEAHALSGAQRWTQLEPDNRLAHGYLGRLYLQRNLIDFAFTSLDVSLGLQEERVEIDYANLAAGLSKDAPARRGQEIYRRFAEQSPDNPGILRAWASLAAEAGDLDLAVDLARQTVALAPGWLPARIMLAHLLLVAGDRSSAFEQMAFAVESKSGLEMELEFIRLLIMAAESGEALERLDRLEVRYPVNPGLYRVRAIALSERGEFDAATAVYEDLLSVGFYVNESLWRLGLIAFEQEHYQEAAEHFRRIKTGPWQLSGLLAQVGAYQGMDDVPKALRTLDDYVAKYPSKRIDTLAMRSRLFVSAQMPVQAIGALDEALAYRPWSIDFWLAKGNLLDVQGNSRKAIDAFRQAYALDPDDPLVLNALGYTLANRTRKYKEAFGYIDLALQQQPDNPAFLDSMGWVLFKQKHFDEAQLWLQRAYEMLNDPEIAAHLGEALWRSKDREAAKAIWGDAAERFPNNQTLGETMRRYKQ